METKGGEKAIKEIVINIITFCKNSKRNEGKNCPYTGQWQASIYFEKDCIVSGSDKVNNDEKL